MFSHAMLRSFFRSYPHFDQVCPLALRISPVSGVFVQKRYNVGRPVRAFSARGGFVGWTKSDISVSLSFVFCVFNINVTELQRLRNFGRTSPDA